MKRKAHITTGEFANYTDAKLAREYGISSARVHQLRKEAGLPPSRGNYGKRKGAAV